MNKVSITWVVYYWNGWISVMSTAINLTKCFWKILRHRLQIYLIQSFVKRNTNCSLSYVIVGLRCQNLLNVRICWVLLELGWRDREQSTDYSFPLKKWIEQRRQKIVGPSDHFIAIGTLIRYYKRCTLTERFK